MEWILILSSPPSIPSVIHHPSSTSTYIFALARLSVHPRRCPTFYKVHYILYTYIFLSFSYHTICPTSIPPPTLEKLDYRHPRFHFVILPSFVRSSFFFPLGWNSTTLTCSQHPAQVCPLASLFPTLLVNYGMIRQRISYFSSHSFLFFFSFFFPFFAVLRFDRPGSMGFAKLLPPFPPYGSY